MDNFRQYIKEAHLKDDEGYEFELTEDKLKMYFYIFNDKYFNNKLKSIPLYCVNVNTASNRNELGDLQTKIDLNNNKIINYCININVDRIKDFSTFRNALVHEMIHYYVNVYYPPTKDMWSEVHTFIRKQNSNENYIKSKINDILKQDEDHLHQGKWLEMATKLNDEFKELNITEITEGINIDPDYIKNYINTYKLLWHNKEELYIFNKDNNNYKNILITLQKGSSKNKDFEGDWYELKINADLTLFDNFIVKTGLTKECLYTNKNVIDLGVNLKAFEVIKLGHIELEIKESTDSEEIYKRNLEIVKNMIFHIE